MDIINIARLIKTKPSGNRFYWTDSPITRSDIRKGIKNGLTELNECFGKGYSLKQWTNEDHVRRVIYFINHPNEIKNISIDNYCISNHIMPAPIIEDGNHRVLAAMCLRMKHIECEYGGRVDILDYLTEKTNEIPKDII